MTTGQTDIMSAIRQIAAERKIEIDEILDAIKESLKLAFKDIYGIDNLHLVNVVVEPEDGTIAVYAKKKVVKSVKDDAFEVTAEEAKEYKKNVKVGDEVEIEITPEGDFGRIAAQTARQVILQKLRESEKESAIRDVEKKIGTIESVIVQRILPEGDILCEINRARAIMRKEDRVPTEFYKLGSRIKVLLKSIEEDTRGKFIHVSRSAPEFLEELFKLEVPEIESETVEIVAIAREAGSRSKVAVRSNSDGVDPIGSCVGQKGVRINAIMNELKLGAYEEKIDIILWDEDDITFIMNALRPADTIKVEVVDKNTKQVRVIVPDEQLSLAIGREGQNARLAAKLTGYDIDVVGENAQEEIKNEELKNEEEIAESSEESVQEENVETTEEVEEKPSASAKASADKKTKKKAVKKTKATKTKTTKAKKTKK